MPAGLMAILLPSCCGCSDVTVVGVACTIPVWLATDNGLLVCSTLGVPMTLLEVDDAEIIFMYVPEESKRLGIKQAQTVNDKNWKREY